MDASGIVAADLRLAAGRQLRLSARFRRPIKERQKGRRAFMNINLTLAPLVSLIAGILILVVPRLLNFIVAIYLIIIGLIGLFGAGNFHLH
jgi:hypothetical protein